jgi:hypothetical protein
VIVAAGLDSVITDVLVLSVMRVVVEVAAFKVVVLPIVLVLVTVVTSVAPGSPMELVFIYVTSVVSTVFVIWLAARSWISRRCLAPADGMQLSVIVVAFVVVLRLVTVMLTVDPLAVLVFVELGPMVMVANIVEVDPDCYVSNFLSLIRTTCCPTFGRGVLDDSACTTLCVRHSRWRWCDCNDG